MPIDRDLDIDEHGARIAHSIESGVENGGDTFAEIECLAEDADARAVEALGIEKARVVGGNFPARRSGRGVGGIGACERAEKRGSIGDRAAHRPRGVLVVRDRDDAGAADQSDRGLDADDTVGRGGADDGAVGLRAHGDRAEIRGDGGA